MKKREKNSERHTQRHQKTLFFFSFSQLFLNCIKKICSQTIDVKKFVSLIVHELILFK